MAAERLMLTLQKARELRRRLRGGQDAVLRTDVVAGSCEPGPTRENERPGSAVWSACQMSCADLVSLAAAAHRTAGGPPKAEPGADAGPAVPRSGAALSTPGMGDRLGGESPLEEEVVLTPSRRQLRRREAGWEGSPRRIPAPRNTNRV